MTPRHRDDPAGSPLSAEPGMPWLGPFAVNVGYRVAQLSPEWAVVELVPNGSHANPGGSVHAGVIATLCTTACALALQARLPPGQTCVTTDLSLKLLAPVRPGGGPIDCWGTVVHLSRRSGLTEARVMDRTGVLHAVATSTCLIIDGPPPTPPGPPTDPTHSGDLGLMHME